MLSVLMTHNEAVNVAEQFAEEIKLARRDQQEDLKKAIDYMYSFKEALATLHPSVLPIIETILKAEF